MKNFSAEIYARISSAFADRPPMTPFGILIGIDRIFGSAQCPTIRVKYRVHAVDFRPLPISHPPPELFGFATYPERYQDFWPSQESELNALLSNLGVPATTLIEDQDEEDTLP